MNWKPFTTEEELATIIADSFNTPQIIFKHSISCSISSMIKNRLEKTGANDNIIFHYLDLINYRSLSNKIAADLKVHHESPQVLVVKNGECIFDESHMAIRLDEIEEQVG